MISKITDYIFLSGIDYLNNVSSIEYIKKNNIKHILCCIKNFDSAYHEKFIFENKLDIDVLFIPYDDTLSQNLWETINICNLKYVKLNFNNTNDFDVVNQWLHSCKNKPMINIAYEYIDNAVNNKEGVIVHCMAGISRSPSIVIYYLMNKYNLSYKDAHSVVSSNRNIINPNMSFSKQLQDSQNLKNMHHLSKCI
jgi:hypothetical protein